MPHAEERIVCVRDSAGKVIRFKEACWRHAIVYDSLLRNARNPMPAEPNPPSRQLLARRALIADGKCPQCRKKATHGVHCDDCAKKQRGYSRNRARKMGGGTWKRGKPGRPPLTETRKS